MYLVENFRTLILVGLVCAMGVTPSLGAICKKEGGGDETCAAEKTLCGVDIKDGKAAGCVDAAACAEANTGELSCVDGKPNCCCTAAETICNDPMAFCSSAAGKDKYFCMTAGMKPTMNATTTPASSNMTDGGNTIPVSAFSSIGGLVAVASIVTFLHPGLSKA